MMRILLTQLYTGAEDVVAARRDALSVDAGVECVRAARGSVHHGGAEQVVGRSVVGPTKQFAPIRPPN